MVRFGPARQLKRTLGMVDRSAASPLASFAISAAFSLVLPLALLAALAASVMSSGVAFAAPHDGEVIAVADAEEHEEVLADRVSVSAPRGMTPSVVAIIQRAASGIGAQSTVVHSGTLDLLSVRRGAQSVQTAPGGMSYPMSSLAVDPFTVRNVSPAAVAAVIERGELVMSESSASVRGARAGDELTIVGWNGGVYNLTVGLVAPDGEVGAELLWSTTVAKAVGFDRPSTVRVWGFASRDGVDAQLLASVPKSTPLRLRHSWDPLFPDDQIGQGRVKVLLGEFAVARGRSGLVLEGSWRAANIVRARLPIIGFVTCHRVVVAAATDALNEIAAAGLGGLINVSDTQRYGGCFNARELRTDTGTSGRNLSRHTWGAAIDINPSTNTFGGTPRIDQRIVQIFRDHGFIWGGSFSIPDGMHFEYIGERVVPTQCPDAPVVDAAAVVPSSALGLHPIDAVRVVDTRIGLGGAQLPLRGGCVLPIDVSAAFSALTVPTGAVPSAVTLNLTGTNAGARGFLTAYPCGMATPTSSNLNVAPGSNWSNQVTVALGAGSRVCVSSSVRTDVIVDVAGWYDASGAQFAAVVPERVADTRLARAERPAGAVAPGSSLRIALGGRAPAGASAVAVTLTSAASDGDGYLTAYSCDGPLPGTSNVNHRAGQIVANHAVVPLGGSRDICVFAYAGGDVVVDVMGWYGAGAGAGSAMHAVAPTRLVDTRAEGARPSVRLADGGELRVSVPAAGGLSSSAITAATVNVTAVDPAGAGYLTVYPCGAVLPTSSNVNYVAGSITAAQTTVGLGTGPSDAGQLCVRTFRAVDVVVDLLAVYG